jgi:hypothetical protein
VPNPTPEPIPLVTAQDPVEMALVAIHAMGLKDIEKNLTPEDLADIIVSLDADQRTTLVLRLSEEVRYFFTLYQAEAQSPMPNALHMAVYGLATGVVSIAAEHIQATIPDRQSLVVDLGHAREFTHKIKGRVLAMVRGQLILPPGAGN